MPRQDYVSISVPRELKDAIQRMLEEHPALGRTVTEYIVNATRTRYLDDLRLVHMGVVRTPPPGDAGPQG